MQCGRGQGSGRGYRNKSSVERILKCGVQKYGVKVGWRIEVHSGSEKMRVRRAEVQKKASEEWVTGRAVREMGVERRGTQAD